ncbi:hypothetical protein ACFLV2_03240 [Chloroflexota bacterium]
MSKKIFSILLVALVMTPAFALGTATPVAAATLAWSAESVPDTSENVLGPPGIDILDMAVAEDGKIIYAVAGDSITENTVYKSVDTGSSWSVIGVDIPADLVAIAPDDEKIIAIADSDAPSVYISTDGGINWLSLGAPQEIGDVPAAVISDIAVSPATNGAHYVAASGEETGGVANIWHYEITAAEPIWQGTRHLAGFDTADAARAVAFSPDFHEDGAMLAVTVSDNVSVDLQVINITTGKCNVAAGFNDYPVSIISESGIADLNSASLSVSPDYRGDEAATRIVFAGLTVDGNVSAREASGVYRLRDSDTQALKNGIDIHSIDHDGKILVAGAYDSNAVYRTDRPLAATGTLASLIFKSPGGENRVVVGLAGSKVIAGTSGDESAFAISESKGLYFDDVSLIDTGLNNISDVAITDDGSNIYLASDDGKDFSLWHYQGSWERVFSLRDTGGYIVRVAPAQTDIIYLAQTGTNNVYLNENRGKGRWLTQNCAVNIRDIAVQGADIAYALSAEGTVSKTTNGGYSWGEAKSTGLSNGSMITLVSDNYLLAGGQNGYVAYSSNGNTSWGVINKILEEGAGSIQVVADNNFASNNTIYAASDKGGQNIKKWVMGTSTAWTDIFWGTLTGGIYGLAIGEDGTLYALEYNSNGQSALWYCGSPATASGYATSFKSVITTATTDSDDNAVVFTATPSALKTSSGGKLWAIKTSGTPKLYSFINILADLQLRSPASGFVNPMNTITGIADEISFSWSRYSNATAYELYIAYDDEFRQTVTTISVSSDDGTVVVSVGPGQSGTANVYFSEGTRYYWRVKITSPSQSLYSATRTFTVKTAIIEVPTLYTPGNGSAGVSRKPSFSWGPVYGADEYQFVLDDNPALDSPIVDITVNVPGFVMPDELDYGKTYYWSVRPLGAGSWSALFNFTVVEKPPVTTSQPSIIVTQAPTPTVIVPAPSPQPTEVVRLTPEPSSSGGMPGYTWVIILIGAALAALVVMLIIRAPRFIGAGAVSEASEGEARPVSFAARSLLWMTSAPDKDKQEILLSGDEERELGNKIITRIKGMAESGLLYVKNPKDAAMFLYLWAHYCSREETDRYLKASFKAGAGNVMDFLRCYLIAPADSSHSKRDIGRQQYDEVVHVVDTESVAGAIKKLYGYSTEKLPDEEPEDPDKKLAYQFLLVHRLVKMSGNEDGRG